MKVHLIGFMGSGKTTVGRLLADRLGLAFYDLDQLIEASQQKTVKEIFAEAGEPEFRRIERDLLAQTRFLADAVIATGGGTFTFDDNIAFIKSEGVSIFLDVPFETILGRIGDKGPTRPLFRDEASAQRLYQYRTKYYKMADHTIEIDPADTAEAVASRLADWLSSRFESKQ